MSLSRTLPRALLMTGVLVAFASVAAEAQGKSKKHTVTADRAIVVTKAVLVEQGYDVVRIQEDGPTYVVYYRRGNMGKGKGKGPVEKMIIRRVEAGVVFEAVPSTILIAIEVKLRIPLAHWTG